MSILAAQVCRRHLKSFTECRTRHVSSLPLLWRRNIVAASAAMENSGGVWCDYLEKICSIIFSRHRDACLIILVNDRYDLAFNTKDDECRAVLVNGPSFPLLCVARTDLGMPMDAILVTIQGSER